MEAKRASVADGRRATGRPSVRTTVIELVRELLPTPRRVRPDETLAELGLDSLAAADLAIGIEERLGVRLPDAEDLELETVRSVIEAVERGAPVRHRIDPSLGTLLPMVTAVGGPAVRAYGRLRVEGARHVPPTGAVVIASNHRSMLDIPVMVVATPRPVFFMAKRELYGDPVRDWVWRRLGGFPVRRQVADLRAIDTALSLLEGGDAVVVYPEGTRSRYGDMLPFLLGSAWLALKAGAPIVPCGVIGTGRQPGWNGRVAPWVGKHVRVRFGEPIAVERVDDARERRLRAEALTTDLAPRVTELMA